MPGTEGTETELVYLIIEELERHPLVHYAVRQNTGGAYIDGRYIAFGYTGAADITGMLVGGRRLEIEVKRPGEWPSDELFAKWETKGPTNRDQRRLLAQRDNLAMVNGGGGLGFVAESVDDVARELGPVDVAFEHLRRTDPDRYRAQLVNAAAAQGGRSRRRRRGRWQELPAGIQGREQ